MEWHHLIIALIFIAGYVIKHIVSTQQEATAQREREAAARNKVGGRLLTAQQEAAKRERFVGGPQPVVAANSDDEVAQARTALDRRIEEAVERCREREETGEEEKPALMSPVPRPIPMAMPKVVIATVPRYQPPSRDRAQPEVRQIPRSELPRAVPPAAPKTAVVPKAVAVTGRLKANVAAVANTMQLVAPTPAPTATSASLALLQALELLKDRQSLTTAFVLREILDRPVSMRRRRR